MQTKHDDRYRWHVLEDLIRDNGYKTFVEVGVATGRTSRYLIGKIKDIFIWGVDPFKTYSEYAGDKNSKSQRQGVNRKKVRKMNRDHPNFIWIEEFSEEAAKGFRDEMVDIVFIDANHDYKYVKQDIELWAPKVRSGGCVAGHDYVSKGMHKGVKKAIDEYTKKNKHTLRHDKNSVWYFFK